MIFFGPAFADDPPVPPDPPVEAPSDPPVPPDPPIEAPSDPPEIPPPPELTGVLKGRVREMGSGLPLSCILHFGTTEFATTPDGRFEAAVPVGLHDVLVECEDHKPVLAPERVRANEVVEVEYRALPYSWDAEIVVYGSENREEVSRTVISGDELRAIPGTFGDPVRALQNLPGVARSQGVEGVIVVRGSEGINTGTYYDEIPVPYLFHFFVGRSIVNPSLLDDVEFYPGGMPSRFGDVTQAVVNVRTLDTRPEPGLHGRVSADLLDFAVSAETRIADHWTAQAGWRTSWIGTLVGLSARIYAGTQGLGGESRPAYPTLQYDDWLLRAAYEDDRDRVVFTAFGAQDSFIFHPPRTDTDGDGDLDELELPDLPYDPNRLMDTGFTRVQARWDRHVGKREQTTWIAAGPDRQQSLLQGLGQLADGIEFGELEGWTFVGRRRDRFPIGADALRTGADVVLNPVTVKDYGEAKLDPPSVPTTGDWRTSLGLWAEYQKSIGKTWVSPGLRLAWQSFNDQSGPQVEPRLSVRHTLTNRYTLTGFVGRFSQIPPADRYAYGLGDPALGVITAWQASAGLEGRWPSGLELDVTAYGSRTDDLVVKDFRVEVNIPPVDPDDEITVPRADSTIVPYYHAVTGYAFGLEGMLRARPRNGLFGWAALTIGRSLRVDEDGVVPGDYDLPVSLVLVGAKTFPKDWRISGRIRVGSGFPYTPQYGVYQTQWDGFTGLPGDNNSARFGIFRQLDLRIDKTWTTKRARWTLYLDTFNTLNTKNWWLVTYEPHYRKLEHLVWIPIIPALGLEVNY